MQHAVKPEKEHDLLDSNRERACQEFRKPGYAFELMQNAAGCAVW
jgi:hypothetical protein